MTEQDPKQRVTFVVTFDDDRAIIARIDEIARREYLNRSDIIRRALRFFIAASPVDGTIPANEAEEVTK